MRLIETTGSSSGRQAAVIAARVPTAAFDVDFALLRNMAIDLRALAREIGNQDAILQGGPGDPDLDVALRQAESDWSGHRRRLHDFLEDAATALDRALSAYQRADRGVLQAASCHPARALG